MGDILKGRIPNKLVPLKHKVDGRWVDLGLGTISPIRDDAGNVQLRIFTRLDEPQYKISPYKELFTDKEIERLETDGHLGSTKKMKDFTSGRELSSMSLSNWRKPMKKWLFHLLKCSNRK